MCYIHTYDNNININIKCGHIKFIFEFTLQYFTLFLYECYLKNFKAISSKITDDLY